MKDVAQLFALIVPFLITSGALMFAGFHWGDSASGGVLAVSLLMFFASLINAAIRIDDWD